MMASVTQILASETLASRSRLSTFSTNILASKTLILAFKALIHVFMACIIHLIKMLVLGIHILHRSTDELTDSLVLYRTLSS